METETEANREQAETAHSRDIWLQAALKTLVNEGIDSVRVERLAKNLHLTKGSFYWHFKNRNDLLAQILDYWSDEMNSVVFEKIAHMDADSETKMFSLMEEITLKARGKYDPAMRAWSKKDQSVAQAVRDVDRRRLAFLSGLLLDAGFEKADAQTRALLLYGYMVGESSVLHELNKTRQLENLRRMVKVILAKPN